MQDLHPRTGKLVPSVAAPALRITGSGPHGSDSTSSSGSDGRLPPASPVLVDPAPYAFPEWTEDPQGGRWHFAEEIELSNDLGQRAFRMRSATLETVNVQQQWQELDALAAHYRGFAAESATVQQETVAFVSDLSGVVRSLARHTDAGLTQAWTEGHTLHQRVRHPDDQLGQLSRSGDELRAEQLSQLSVLTALQANTAAAVAAAAAAPDLATIKAAMEVEIKRAVEAQLGPLTQRINELEQREAEHRRALPGYVDQLKATMASAAAATGSTAGSTTTPADPSIRPLKTKLATMEAELQQVQLTMENERRAGSEFRHSILNSISLMTTAPVAPAQPPLGPMPPPTDSDCFADQVRAQGERLTALDNQVAGCNELIKEFKSQLEGLQGEEGVEEGPRDGAFAIQGAHHPVHTPDFSGHSEMACQVADVHTHVHVTPHPHVHVIPQPYVHTHAPCAATHAAETSELPGYHPPQGLTEMGPPAYHPPHGPQSAEFSFSGPPPGYAHQHTHQHQPYSSMPPQAHHYCAERRHLQGLHPRHFDARGNFDPRVILRWPEDEELPKVKPVGIPAWGMAFAEVPDDQAPSPVDNPTTFNQFWATTGPGAYGHQATPHLDPTSLGDLQRVNLRPKWDGKGETVHHYLLKWRRWERSVGRALGEEARIVEILASIPPKIADPIEDRHLRRCLSYKEVKEEVEWEARNKTNVDLFRDTYKSTAVPAH